MPSISPRARRPLAIALLLAWWLVCWLATGAWFDQEAQEAYRAESLDAERFVAGAGPSYKRIIEMRVGVSRMLARDPEIRRTLARFDANPPPPTDEEERRRRWSADPALAQISRFLDASVRDLGLDVIMLLDVNGNCVAASNAGSEKSVVGASYGNRDDFLRSRAGHSGYLATMGKRMGSTGLAFHAPVTDHGRFIGAVFGGNALAPFANLIDQEDAFLSDRNGVVLLARDPSFMMQALPGAPASRLDAATRQALYQRTELTLLDLAPWGDKRFPELLRVPGRAVPALLRKSSIMDGGLVLNVLRPMPQLAGLARQRLLYAGASGGIGTLALLLAAGYARRRREQRVMALALAEREQKFRSLAESSPDFVMRNDREGRVLYMNARLQALMGLSAGHVIGKTFLERWPDGRYAALEAAGVRAMERGEEVVIQLGVPNGGTHQIHVVPERDAGGAIVGRVSFGRDITALRQSGQDARNAHDFLNLAIDAIADPIFLKDRAHRWVLMNQSFCDLLGQPRESLIGKSDFDFFAEKEARVFWDKDELVFNAGIENVNEEKITDGKGVTRIIVTKKSPITTSEGQQFLVGIISDISARKQTERLVRAKEREFRTLAENNPDIIIRYDRECRRIYVNPALATMAGRKPDELIGRVTVDHTPLTDPERYMAELRQVMESGAPSSFEVPVRRANGEAGWYTSSLVPEFDEDGHVVGVLTVARDITGRKHMEEALALREQEFRSLAKNLPVAVIRYDSECRRRYLNPSAERMLHGSQTELLGHEPGGHTVPATPAMIAHYRGKMEEVLATDTPCALDFVLDELPADNQEHYEVRFVPEHDADGKTIGVLAIWNDITERKQAQALLEQREHEYRSLAENMPDNIARWDTEGRYLYVNPIHERTLGMAAADLIGKRIDELFPDTRMQVKAAIEQVAATGQAALFVRQPVLVNGEMQTHDVNLMPERDADGKIVSVLGLGRNLTDLYRLQDALATRERELRALADSSPGMMGTFHARPDGSICMPYVSPNVEQIFGIHPQDLANDASPLMALNHPDDAQRVAESIAESARCMTTWHEEYRILHPTLGERWVESNTNPEPHPDGGIVWYGYVCDITERKHAQHRMELLDRAINLSSDRIFLVNDQLRFAYVNAAACQSLGYSREELMAMGPLDINPDFTREMIVEMRKNLFAGDDVTAFESRHRAKDGRVFPIELSTSHFEEAGAQFNLSVVRDITARKRAQDALRASRESLNEAQRIAQVGSWALDLSGNVLAWSDEIFRIFEIDPQQFSASYDAFLNAIHPDDREAVNRAYAESVENRTPYEIEHRLLMADGRIKHVHEHCETHYAEDGKPLRSLGTVQDITERRRTEVALQENFDRITELNIHLEKQALALNVSQEQLKLTEAWYRGILHSAPDGMLVIDGHGVIVQVNAQLEIMFGYEGKELIGSRVEMLLPAAIREIHVGKRIDFVASGRVDRPMAAARHLRACRKDGSEFPVDVSLSQLPDIAGRVGVICAAIRDITERKRLEDEIARRESEFRTLVENSPDTVIRYDRECRRTYCNPATLEFVGVPLGDVLGKTTAESSSYQPDVSAAVTALVRRVIDSGQAGDMELEWAKMGVPAWLQFRVNPEFDHAGQVVSALSVGRDVTALKLAEARLLKSRDILRALAAHQETEHEKERQELAYQIHEDLAQNLAALRLNISLFEMSGESVPRAPLLKTLHDIADRSITRIRDIVAVLRPTVLDLGLVPALHWLTDDFKGVGLQFDLALPEDILLSNEASTFLYRAAREALLNVALHAAATHIHVSLDTVADVCRLVVRDNGCGFDPAAPQREGRFGLIRLTEQARHLGGNLAIDSTPDQGTALEIHVPAFTEYRSQFSK